MVKYLLVLPSVIFASQLLAQNSNVINTAVPFLRITPDARAGAVGDAGIAMSPDAYSIFWNTAKLIFIQNKFGLSTTFNTLYEDASGHNYLFDAASYWKIDSNNAVTASFHYFNFGELTFTDISGINIGPVHPNEYALHIGYSRRLSHDLSAGINFGYVRSHIPVGFSSTYIQMQNASTLMADVSLFYIHAVQKNSVFKNYNLGFTISNLGAKMSYYGSSGARDFLPTNLGLGSNFNFDFGKDHRLSLALNLNKLLVPTPDTAGNYRNESVLNGVFKSFADAPGGLHEELQEINLATGAEYWWKKLIALRTGYFYESEYKGSRQYLTVGGGIKYHVIQLDYSFIISTSETNNARDESMRFSLSFDLNDFRKTSPKKL